MGNAPKATNSFVFPTMPSHDDTTPPEISVTPRTCESRTRAAPVEYELTLKVAPPMPFKNRCNRVLAWCTRPALHQP